MNVIFTQ